MHHFTTVKLQQLLEETINLYQEYIDQHERDEDQAKAAAVLETMQNIDALVLCATCGLPLDPQDQANHIGHEPNCPYYGREVDDDGGCDCDLHYHPDCCPECNDIRSPDNYNYTASDFAFDVARENGRL